MLHRLCQPTLLKGAGGALVRSRTLGWAGAMSTGGAATGPSDPSAQVPQAAYSGFRSRDVPGLVGAEQQLNHYSPRLG